jgi:hypothetical protein
MNGEFSMKKIIVIVLFSIICLFSPSSTVQSKFNKSDLILLTNDQTKISTDKYQEMLSYLLNPYLQDEIDKYYSEYLTISPTVYTYYPYTEVLNVEKMYSGQYHIKLRIKSVTGPHIQVGTDNITLKIGPRKVEVVKFEHIKSFELPENYEKYIKEGYSNPIP